MKLRFITMAFAALWLAVACQTDGLFEEEQKKDDTTEPGTDVRVPEGEKFNVSINAHSGVESRTIIDQDGYTVKWVATDELGAHRLQSNTPWDLMLNAAPYRFTTNDSDIKNEGLNAVFSASGVPAGEYLFYYPYGAGEVTQNEAGVRFSLPQTQTQDGTSIQHIYDYDVMLSDGHVSVTENGVTGDVLFNHIYALMDFPISLSAAGDQDIFVTGVSIRTADASQSIPLIHQWNYNSAAGTSQIDVTAYTEALYLDVTGSPALAAGTEYNVTMLVPAMNYAGAVDIVVTTNLGDWTLTKTGMSFEASKRYTARGLSVDPESFGPEQEISGPSDWEAAVAKANETGVAEFILTSSFTLTDGYSMPEVPMTFKGSGTLTFDLSAPVSEPAAAPFAATNSDYNLQYNSINRKVVFKNDVTIDGNVTIAVNKGIVEGTNLTIAQSAGVTGNGRIILSGNLTANAAFSTAANIVVSCDRLVANAGITNNGGLYCSQKTGSGTVSGKAAVIKSAAQMPNSSFEEWYRATFLQDTWYIAKSDKDADRWWDSGNPGTGSQLGGKTSLTTPEETIVVSGKAVKMSSKYLKTTIGSKFAAGNIYIGKYSGLSGLGVKMVWGRKFDYLPTALVGYYRYNSGTIDHGSAASGPDFMNLYIALANRSFTVDTNDTDSYPDIFTHPDILAYGQISSSETVGQYKKFRIELTYNTFDLSSQDVYIMVAGSSSKYGNEFCGSTNSILYIDEFQLEY